ncbi:hypothetical protein ACHAXT_010583 [Thalassiosira profunda]
MHLAGGCVDCRCCPWRIRPLLPTVAKRCVTAEEQMKRSITRDAAGKYGLNPGEALVAFCCWRLESHLAALLPRGQLSAVATIKDIGEGDHFSVDTVFLLELLLLLQIPCAIVIVGIRATVSPQILNAQPATQLPKYAAFEAVLAIVLAAMSSSYDANLGQLIKAAMSSAALLSFTRLMWRLSMPHAFSMSCWRQLVLPCFHSK